MSDELRDNLEKVHAELVRHPQLDPPTVASLRRLLGEITAAIDESAAPPVSPVPSTADDFASQVETLVARFETRHPQLSAALAKIATALADLGI